MGQVNINFAWGWSVPDTVLYGRSGKYSAWLHFLPASVSDWNGPGKYQAGWTVRVERVMCDGTVVTSTAQYDDQRRCISLDAAKHRAQVSAVRLSGLVPLDEVCSLCPDPNGGHCERE